MKKLLVSLLVIPFLMFGQTDKKSFDLKKEFKKFTKFSTFYGGVNGGTSLADDDTYSITTGTLNQSVIETPFDYSIIFGVRKIARFGYLPKEAFKKGTENSFSDAATIGKVSGFEFLFQGEYKRQQGLTFFDQHHFLRYVADKWMVKTEYLKDGFADIEYFEGSQRFRQKVNKKLSFSIGVAQRISEPYGFNPLDEWVLENGNLHYTYLALQEGYEIDPFNEIYTDPNGNIVANSNEVWEEVIIPQVLDEYVINEKNKLPNVWNHSLIAGFDYYSYKKDFWLHAWGNILPLHWLDDNEYSYQNFQGGQWIDYSGGLIFGYWFNKNLGIFIEGKYNKYWNREWHNFSFGINYKIF
jgi:hypothetical protein|tara:strand:+ start:922 stop:1983 length:1062 start_codon:yes stop_codon:yes gene_type:complete